MTTPKTLTEAIRYFASVDNCREYLVSRRWPNGVTCPVCGSDKVYFDSSRNGWECKTRHPKRKFTLKTGTIFEDSALGFDKWLPAVWLIANCKNGVSSHELARALGVTQKTAWFMLHRIRLAMQDDDGGGKLGGEVEVDETYIGGKGRNMSAARKRKMGMRGKSTGFTGKVAVMGLLERHGEGRSRVRTRVVPNNKRSSLQPIVREQVEAGATVHTDALLSCFGLDADYIHNVIDHAECYAQGTVHTNGMENFWSLLKRGLRGTYVSVEPFHLFRYLDEQAFRFNTRRDMNDADRFSAVVHAAVAKRLTYDALTGKEGLESRLC
ncbi:MAG: IS1595 family transposase [Vicinamibacterales bacterium]